MKYKIVKDISKRSGGVLYKVYRHRFWIFWKLVDFQFSIEAAEKRILDDKKDQALKKTKPEVVGYYE